MSKPFMNSALIFKTLTEGNKAKLSKTPRLQSDRLVYPRVRGSRRSSDNHETLHTPRQGGVQHRKQEN